MKNIFKRTCVEHINTAAGLSRLALALNVALVAAGCGGGSGPSPIVGEPPIEHIGLMEVGEMYAAHLKEHGKPPTRTRDFEKYSQGFTIGSMGVQKGDLIVVWNAGKEDDAALSSTRVLAYEKKTPKEGGEVLMQDGTIKVMTAEEFQAAPKAAPSS
jgi:hypothetical protein